MLFKLFLILAIAYATLTLGSSGIANKMIFPKVPASYEDGPDTLKLKTNKGAKITAVYLEVPDSRQLLIYSHGNGEDIGMVLDFLKGFSARGISVLVYDYPGYGTSSHKPTESGVYAAADAVYKFATQTLNFAPEQIVLYGRSLGSGPSCWLAERYPVNRLILDGAFTSTYRVITRIKLFPVDKFDNLSRLKHINCPILSIHGKKDRTVPFEHAMKSWKVLRGEKQKLWVDSAGHNDLPEVAGSLYWNTVESFIKQAHGIEQTNE